MHTDPLPFFREDFVDLFHRGVAQMKERAEAGDARSKARYEDTVGARGAVYLLFEGDGGGELWLTVEGGEMRTLSAAPTDVPVRMAVAVPASAAKTALEEVADADLLESERAPRHIARSASAEIERTLEGHTLEFHVTFTDLPADPDEVTLRVAIGAATPPAEPKFSAEVSWDDIEDVRDGELTPQQLFGRLKLTGDATQAMALGMTLMQRRAPRA